MSDEKQKRYMVNEVFLSLQGEGVRAGTLNVFVRLSKCNMACRVEPGDKSPGGFDCDTEFESGRRMTAEQILEEVLRLWPHDERTVEPLGKPWVVLTGGEPLLQYDLDLWEELHSHGVAVAVETNGSLEVPRTHQLGDEVWAAMPHEQRLAYYCADWITVSPKVAEHAVRQRDAHEVKYVRGAGQAAPQTSVCADLYLVSPAHDGLRLDPEALATCQRIIRDDPRWRLSVQQHKAWRVR